MAFLLQARSETTRSYAEELQPSQLHSLRMACLLAAPLLIAFSLLDRVFAPSSWLALLAVRTVAAGLLLLVARRTSSPAAPFGLLAGAGVAIIGGALELAIFRTGGVQSPYLYSVMTILAGISILVPMQLVQALFLNLEVLVIALLPLALVRHSRADDLSLAAAGSYLFCLAVISVAGAGIQDRLRRGEHRARAEFARHAGLLNLGTLAGGLAHELANPLNAMFMQVELLARDPAGSEKRLQSVRTNLLRMKDILEAMRSGARTQTGERRQVDLRREMDLAVTLVEGKLRNKVGLVRAYAEVPPVYCSPTLLGQVLVNLIANAADAVVKRPGGKVALRVRSENALAILEIEDNGPGVPEELRSKIFEPFFSTKGDAGNGLGLWISSEIARLHGGTLTVHEGQWGGALFRFAMPLDARAEAPPNDASAEAPLARSPDDRAAP